MISKGLLFPLGLLGGLAIACSDPVPPPAQGDSHIRLFAAASNPSSCSITGSSQIPTQKPGDPARPDHTQNDPGSRVVDGQSGAGVTCRVAGSSTFTFNGSMSSGNASFNVSGSITKGGGGSGRVSAAGPVSAGHAVAPSASKSDPSCTFSVAEQNLQVAAGHVWATFSCPTVRDNENSSIICAMDGEFVLENCEQ